MRVSHGSNVTDFKPRGLSPLIACLVSMMGDEAVHTPFLTDLNEATLDVVPVARYQDVEKEYDGGESGGRRGDARHMDKNTWKKCSVAAKGTEGV